MCVRTDELSPNENRANMLQQKRNEALNLVRMSNRVINAIRISESESKEHQDKKIEICRRLAASGRQFITEAIFKTGGRADIFNLDDFEAIEIVHTETEQSIAEKLNKYPEGITIIVVRC